MIKNPVIRAFALHMVARHNISGPSRERSSERNRVHASIKLEERLEDIDSRLEELSSYTLRSGVGSIGFHSVSNKDDAWVEIYLDKEYPIDQIVIVPTVRRDTNEGFQADGFPKQFRIVAGTNDNENGDVIAEYDSHNSISNGIAPLVISIPEVEISWIRLEATELGIKAWSGSRTLMISEIMIFSGPENVAFRRPLETSTNATGWAKAWDNRFLVDGHTPYLMNSATGKQSVAYASDPGESPALMIDLETSTQYSRIHLHAIEQGDTVPQAFRGDLGIPQEMRIKGATKADFSDSRDLLVYHREGVVDSGPIMMWRIQETPCRYVMIEEIHPEDPSQSRLEPYRIGFAEIELISKGDNVELGAPVTAIPTSQASRIRERIAADLHDELGADLQTIGLYSDFAMDSLDSREELVESLQLIREFTDRSGTSAKHCINILEAKGVREDLIEEIRTLSKRMLADHHHYEIDIEGEEFIRDLKPQKRIDLFLFYKECLTNILRHSESTEVSVRIESNGSSTKVSVSDNGIGIAESNGNETPPSLKRRARLMKAKIRAERPPTAERSFHFR